MPSSTYDLRVSLFVVWIGLDDFSLVFIFLVQGFLLHLTDIMNTLFILLVIEILCDCKLTLSALVIKSVVGLLMNPLCIWKAEIAHGLGLVVPIIERLGHYHLSFDFLEVIKHLRFLFL